MRYGIFSDIHSNIEAFDAVMHAYQDESIDKYLCAGDIVGYAANPKECIERVKEAAMITVAGNHDWATVNLFSVEYFNPTAKEAILWTRRNLNSVNKHFLESLKPVYKNEDLALVHGTLDNPFDFNYMADSYIAEETFRLLQAHICFVGHTHVAGFFIKDKDECISHAHDNYIGIENGKKYIVNVGSIGQPRDGNSYAAYCIYDTDTKEVRIKRIGYANEVTRKKIIDARLPKFLGDRLLVGR